MVGLDCGTSTVVSSRIKDGKVESRYQRDAFLDLQGDEQTKKILEQVGAKYIVKDDKVLITGDEALSFANLFKQEVRRPMYKGVVSNKDPLARDVLCEIVKSVVGKPESVGEHCFFTVPAAPLDVNAEDFDILYHSEIIAETLNGLGYKAHPINEALCLVYKELASSRFTGLAISFGAGMSNVCLAHLGIVNKGAQYSTLMGGDWIDKQVANRRAGLTNSKVTRIKEDQKNPIHLINDDGSSDILRDAICKYYRALIRNVLENMFSQFKDVGVDYEEALPIVIAGGTSMIAGFMPVFEQELKKLKAPFKIGEIKHSTDPLFAVSQGALIRAQLEK